MAGATSSRAYAAKFADAGAIVIDNSSAFRMFPTVPLVVANVNDHAIGDHEGIVANPNCTTMAIMMAAGPLHKTAGLRTMIATSYQSVSGSGQTGMTQLAKEIDHFNANRDGLAVGDWSDPMGRA